MMNFLDKIYGYEHFGIILFAVIAVLVVLFLIVLFFGKKDEKKRELEKTAQLQASNTTDAFAPVTETPVELNLNEPNFAPVENIIASTPIAPVIKEDVAPITKSSLVEPIVMSVEETTPVAPILEPTVEVPIASVVEPVGSVAPVGPTETVIEPTMPSQAVSEIPVEPVMPEIAEVKEELPNIEIPNFNFDELAASIASELNAIENKPVSNIVETPVVPTTPEVQTFEKIVTTEPVVAPVTPINEVVKPTPAPVTFSSVYINKPANVTPEVKVEPVVETPVVPVTPVAPTMPVTNPGIELPKPAEMPTLNQAVTETPVKEQPINAVPDFSQFTGETYDIK